MLPALATSTVATVPELPMVTHALRTLTLDWCNMLYMDLPLMAVQKQQLVCRKQLPVWFWGLVR